MPADPRHVALVALGGALGSVARFLLAGALDRDAFPWGTLAVNVLGCLAIGALLGSGLGPSGRAFVAVGVLGGFTTMSAFSGQAVTLAGAGRVGAAAGLVALTLAACLGATALGLAGARALRG